MTAFPVTGGDVAGVFFGLGTKRSGNRLTVKTSWRNRNVVPDTLPGLEAKTARAFRMARNLQGRGNAGEVVGLSPALGQSSDASF